MRLHNTMTGKVEELVPLEAGKVRMYNCGPTVYKRNTVGNFRAYVMADLLRRALEHLGYEVEVMWIPGHVDIAGTEHADRLAAAGARLTQLDVPLDYFTAAMAISRMPVLTGCPCGSRAGR